MAMALRVPRWPLQSRAMWYCFEVRRRGDAGLMRLWFAC